jgi:hypothetical protein
MKKVDLTGDPRGFVTFTKCTIESLLITAKPSVSTTFGGSDCSWILA